MKRLSKTIVEYKGKTMRFNKEEQITFIEEMMADLESKVREKVVHEVREQMRAKVASALAAFDRVVKAI
jgi:hypothetical protein